MLFITENKEKPFFLYLPHSMPHVPLFVPEDVYDPNPANAYKCVIEHIDAEVGRIMKTIKDLKLSKNTYVIYTTDNGPWLPYKNHGGSALPLREGKGTTYEGGQRVPCVMWGPGRIPAGTSTEAFTSTMDLLPSIAKLDGIELKARGKIDGIDISSVMHGDNDSPRNEFLYYSSRGELQGIRVGDFKLRIAKPRPNRKKGNKKPAAGKPVVQLYNLKKDISEIDNLADKMPEKVKELKARMQELDAEIEENQRSPGKAQS